MLRCERRAHRMADDNNGSNKHESTPFLPRTDEEHQRMLASWVRLFGPEPELPPELEAELAAAQVQAQQEVDQAALSETERGVMLSGHQPGYTQNRNANGTWAPSDGGREIGAGEERVMRGLGAGEHP